MCADLILKGFIAFPSEQGLSFDAVLSANNKLYKVQVKTTRQLQVAPQRKCRIERYTFNVRRCGKDGRKSYQKNDVDIFALVALDVRTIGYIKASEVKQTMFFAPENNYNVSYKYGRKTCVRKKLSEYKLSECLI